jgi:hypothetical protein
VRRRRAHHAGWALALVLALPGSASAQSTAIDLGPGTLPSVAIDDLDYAHVAWNGPEGSNASLHYCRLPPGASACDINLTVPTQVESLTRPFVFARSGVQILSYRYGFASGAFDRDLLYTATDGGRSFSGPVAVGSVPLEDAKYGPGTDLSVVGNPRYQRIAQDGSTADSYKTFPDQIALAVDLTDTSAPLVVFENGGSLGFRRFYPPGDPNVSQEWSQLVPIGDGSYPRLAGDYLLTFDGNAGLRVRMHRRGEAVESPGTFKDLSVLPDSLHTGPNADIAQGSDGTLQAVWTDLSADGVTLYRATSLDGIDWKRSVVRPAESAHIDDPRVAAGQRGSSVVAWRAAGSDPHVFVRRTTVRAAAPRVEPPNLRATGLEVTQGIQTREERFAGGELPSGRDEFGVLTGRPSTYEGVMLAEHARTVVRFFANTDRSEVGGVGASLYGYRDGRALPGSPLRPLNGKRTLSAGGCACVLAADRLKQQGSFDFTLPDSWTTGAITLRGTLSRLAVSRPFQVPKRVSKLAPLKRPAIVLKPAVLCLAATCASDDDFQLEGVRFTRTARIFIAPLRMIRSTKDVPNPMPDPDEVFDAALKLHPGGERYVVLPYVGDVDVSSQFELKPTDPQCKALEHPDDCRQQAYFAAVQAYADRHPIDHDLHIGINNDERGAANDSLYNLPPGRLDPTFPDEHVGAPAAFVNPIRPITSVAHELGHLIGRAHAGRACGGGGDAWPPDDRGLIGGVGFDRYGIFAPLALGAPQGVVAPGADKEAPEWFDVMSYCGGTGEGASLAHWISVRGWNSEVGELHRYGERVGFDRTKPQVVALPPSAPRAAMPGDLLAVRARSDAAATTIETVQRSSTASPGAPSADTFLVGRGADGTELARVVMAASAGHVDGGSSFTTLRAAIPAAGVTTVEIVRDGTTLASRTRSPAAPTVSISTPRAGARVPGHGSVAVTWHAADADGDSLLATVLYSRDDGREWRTLSIGPDTGRASLPAAYFAGSRRARVMVIAGDGFNETAATSGRFRAAGTAPAVRILSPEAGSRVPADSTAYLSGEAIADSLQVLSGRRLRWFDGRRLLGTGEHVAARGLRPGLRRIRLVATDVTGRGATATTTLHVLAVDPEFTVLRAPGTLPKASRRLRLTVAANVPARLTLGVDGRRASFAVGPAARRVAIVVPRRRKLQLGLLLRAGGRAVTSAIIVPRR